MIHRFRPVAPLCIWLAVCGSQSPRADERDDLRTQEAEIKTGGTTSPESWTTRVAYRIEEPERPAEGFDPITRVRVGANGERIAVTDGSRSGRVRIWSPEGKLLASIGDSNPRGGVRVWADARRLHVQGSGLVASYSFEGGEPITKLSLPPGFERFAPMPDGSLLGLGSLPGWDFGDEVTLKERAVFRATEVEGAWHRDTVFTLDIRRLGWYITMRGEGSRHPSLVSVSQPFADTDLAWFDRAAGSLGVLRRNGSPGEVEVFEILSAGDTVWHLRIGLPAVPLMAEDAERAIQGTVERLRRAARDGGHVLTVAQLRQIAERAVHIPSHLPVVTRAVATGSGEVWLQTSETEDGLSVWYAVERRQRAPEPRRVLIPRAFELMDAFGSHIWGLFEEDSGATVVLGLRLVPPSS